MRIAVIGAGAAGSVIAGFLSKTQNEILLVGRPRQVRAIQEHGLWIQNAEGRERISVATAEKLDQEYDLVIFAVPYPDLEFAYQDNHAFLENCMTMSIQSGVQGANILSCHFEPDKIISSVLTLGATCFGPGEVCLNHDGVWLIGKPYVTNDTQIFELADIFKSVFEVEVSFDITGMQWLQLLWDFRLAIPALVGQTQREVFADLDFCRLSMMLLGEGFEIIQAAAIEIVSLPHLSCEQIQHWLSLPLEAAAKDIQKHFRHSNDTQGPGTILERIKRNRPSEIDFINGEVTLVAASLRMTAPLNAKVVRLIHQIEETQQFFNPTEIKKFFKLG